MPAAFALSDAAFEAKYGFKKPTKENELVFYCRAGVRSTTASHAAQSSGYSNIKNYKGSWLEWCANH